jgi:ParB family chromosome partitioning protein
LTAKKPPITLPSVDALFGIPNTGESVQEISIKQLHSFRDHPFRIEPDEKLIESVREYGILSPLLARKKAESEYEIISGHRRKAAAEQMIGLDKLPVLVRDLMDEEAIILMVDSNIQRENLLPSKKAFAYRMKLEAIKRQGQQG